MNISGDSVLQKHDRTVSAAGVATCPALCQDHSSHNSPTVKYGTWRQQDVQKHGKTVAVIMEGQNGSKR